jgi:hypothetical protein
MLFAQRSAVGILSGLWKLPSELVLSVPDRLSISASVAASLAFRASQYAPIAALTVASELPGLSAMAGMEIRVDANRADTNVVFEIFMEINSSLFLGDIIML